MSTVRLSPLDLNQNELQNPRAQNLASDPVSPVAGQFWFNSSEHRLKYYDGTTVIYADGQSATLTYGTPVASAVGDTAAAGAATSVARSDHRHAREAFGAVTAETSYGLSAANGSAATVSHSDHTHGTPAIPRLDQLAAQAADYSFGGYKATNLAAPTAATDAANKSYVDSVRQGMDPKDSVAAASTANVSVSAFSGTTLDGVTLTSGTSRVLLKDQTAAAENGIWVYNGNGAALTRATDGDASGEISVGTSVFVEAGTVNGGQLWVATATGATPWVPGTSSSSWTQFSGASPVTAGAGLTSSGNVFNVVGTANRIDANANNIDISASYAGQASITTLGTVTAGTWNGTPVDVAHGGTGATTAAGARTALGAGGAGYGADVGDGSSTAIVVTHNLGTRDVTIALRQTSSPYAFVEADYEATTTNTVTLRFATAPTAAQYRVIVVPV